MSADFVPTAEQALLLLLIFEEAAQAGYGFADGLSFHAIPGLEDAAADYIRDRIVNGADE